MYCYVIVSSPRYELVRVDCRGLLVLLNVRVRCVFVFVIEPFVVDRPTCNYN